MISGGRDTAVLSFYIAFGCMQGILCFDRRLRRVRESLRVEKTAHAVTREKLHDCEAESARMQGRGETEGAAGEGREEVTADQCDVRRETSPATGDDSGGNVGDRVAVQANTVADEVVTAAEATQCSATEPKRGQSSCAANMRTSPEMQDEVGDRRLSHKIEDDVGGVSKVGDEGPSDAVHEEPHMGEETVEGDVAGEEREAVVGDGGRRSSTLVQHIKQRGRRRKVAAVRLSPYTCLLYTSPSPRD